MRFEVIRTKKVYSSICRLSVILFAGHSSLR